MERTESRLSLHKYQINTPLIYCLKHMRADDLHSLTCPGRNKYQTLHRKTRRRRRATTRSRKQREKAGF